MYKDCDNFSRIYYTNSITSDTASVTLRLPNCIRSSRVFLLKINQAVPSGSKVLYVSLGDSTEAYPLVDIKGVAVTSDKILLHSILLVAKVCNSDSCCPTTANYMLVNYAMTRSTSSSDDTTDGDVEDKDKDSSEEKDNGKGNDNKVSTSAVKKALASTVAGIGGIASALVGV